MNVTFKYRYSGALLGLLVSCAAFAEVPSEQLQAFLGRVPEWGEPAIKLAEQDALRQQYAAEVARAQANRYARRHHHHHRDHHSGHPGAGYEAADGVRRHCGGEYRCDDDERP